MREILRDIQAMMKNQYLYGNESPRYLYCNPDIAKQIIELSNFENIDDNGKAYVFGLEIIPTRNTLRFYVR